MKSVEWHERRRQGIGGSDANILMSGDAEKIYKLWETKIGKAEPDNLDWVLPVQIGVATEELNAQFTAHKTGREIIDRNKSLSCDVEYMRCEIDGMTTTEAGEPAIWDAKHVNQFSKIEDVTARYLPQMHHNAYVAGVRHYVLSVIIGTMKLEIVSGEIDDAYMIDLLAIEEKFWDAVQSGTPPDGAPVVAAPVPRSELKTVDMSGSNAWASAAIDWSDNKEAAKKHADAAKTLKDLVPPDVGVASGNGVVIKRSKSNALIISGEIK